MTPRRSAPTPSGFLDEITLETLEDDPYPVYAELRRRAPVAWIPAAGVWFVSTFEDCAAVGRGEHGFTGATDHPTLQRVFGAPNVLTASGPVHDDLRAGIDPTLQRNPVTEVVEQVVRPMARARLRALEGTPGADLMAEYLEPISVEALRGVMGLDGVVDTATLRRWFAELNVGVSNFGQDPAAYARADAVNAEIEAALEPLMAELTAHPDGSMLSHMLWAGREGSGQPRPVGLILPSIKVILLGGMQEPGHAAGSTLHGLLGESDQLARVVADPAGTVPLAVHEGLRWIAPIGAVERQAAHDVVLAGQRVPAGSVVQTIVASANRDEARFEDPDRFDLDRADRVHQAFGNGEHFCAGHFFARQTEHVMLEELVRAFPGLHADPGREPVVTGWTFRAPKVLPVLWGEAPREREVVTVREGARAFTVRSMTQEADAVLSLELVPADGGPAPTWTPGAHVDLWSPDGTARQYSLCGSPGHRRSLRVAVLLDEEGRGGSRWVHRELRPGDVVEVGDPRSTFALEPAPAYLFVAGGIGVTPLVPMAEAAAAQGVPFDLLYCGRRRSGMAFLDELAVHGERVRVHAGDEGGRADVAAVVAATAPGTVVHACGPERLLTVVEAEGLAAERAVVVERFANDQAGPREDDAPFEVRLVRDGRTLGVPADRSVVSVLHDAGVAVPTSCQEGSCGSCETRVLRGAVDHRDVLLTPAQRAVGDRMYVCVSRAGAGTGALDLDL